MASERISSVKNFLVLGVSHRTAAVELREALARKADELQVLNVLRDFLDEAIWLSTCNRLEVYGCARDLDAASFGLRALFDEWARPEAMSSHLYEYRGTDAVRHVFRVSSSLDSMVVGEPQILGQVKQAYAHANQAGALGPLLGRCFDRGFGVAKRIRSETGIAQGSVSVGSIACDLASKIFGDLTGKHVMLIGAGKMGEVSARYLAAQGAKLIVVNRSPERATQLAAACGGVARAFAELEQTLIEADVVIASTASPGFIITRQQVKEVLRRRRHRPLFIIDIALPRDIEPEVGKLPNVFLYDIDDLQQVSQDTVQERVREAHLAETMIEREVTDFMSWLDSLAVKGTIVALRRHFKEKVLQELERTRQKGLASLGDGSMDRTADAIVAKLLHHPIQALRQSVYDRDKLIQVTHKLFNLGILELVEGSLPPPPQDKVGNQQEPEQAEETEAPSQSPSKSGVGS